MGDHPLVSCIAFAGILVLLLATELGVISRAADPSLRRSAWWSVVVVAAAAVFGVVLLVAEGRTSAIQFATGYIIEFSLSVDNLLVFIIVLRYFGVPAALRPTAIKWGILGAVVMRGVMIAAGALVLNELAWVIYLLGLLLLFTGFKMLAKPSEETVDVEHNPLLRVARRVLPVTGRFEGTSFFVRRTGKWAATPLLLVVLVIEWTDLMFATDSIPAIFAITRDPFIVYTSNILAIVGLRALFFVIAAVIVRFAYLRFGVAAVLMFVGAKMLLTRWIYLPTGVTLAVVVVALGASVLASPRTAITATERRGDR